MAASSEYGEPEETLTHPSEWIAGAARPTPPFPYYRGGSGKYRLFSFTQHFNNFCWLIKDEIFGFFCSFRMRAVLSCLKICCSSVHLIVFYHYRLLVDI